MTDQGAIAEAAGASIDEPETLTDTSEPAAEAPAAEKPAAEAAQAEALEAEAEAPEAEAPAAPTAIFKVTPTGSRWNLASVTAISFSLTFVGVSIALLTGFLPPAVVPLAMPVDLGVLLLIVPLTALVLAILAEAFRGALRGVPEAPAPRTVTALSDWRPGHGEG
jgi:hypothetical protein